jgi:hypothetical protein
MPFLCSICGEESTRICVRCTKDACANHLCERCLRCSDCCECQVALDEAAHGAPAGSARAVLRATVGGSRPEPEPAMEPRLEPDPAPLPPNPASDPQPVPGDETVSSDDPETDPVR